MFGRDNIIVVASDPLEELKKRLYKKEESFAGRMKRPSIEARGESAPPFWRHEPPPNMTASKPPFYMSWKFIILLAAAVALIVGGLWATGIFKGVSGRNIDITILAPQSLEGGEKIVWEVSVQNRNARALTNAELNFQYPPGARPLGSAAKNLREKRELGRVGPGEAVKETFEAFLFGYEGEEKRAWAEFEYQPENSSAILAEEREVTTKIVRSPVGVSIEMPSSLRSGQEFEMKINYISNARGSLENLFIKLEHPAGFSYEGASFAPEDDGTLWRVGTLDAGERGTLTVRGLLSGNDQEQRSFNASVVTREGEEFRTYGGGSFTATLSRPFLEIALKTHDNFKAARPGEIIFMEAKYKNNLPIPVQNVSVEVRITGAGIDERKIRAVKGDWRAATRSVVWKVSSESDLEELAAGEEGTLRFEFAFLNPPPIRTSADKNFSALLEARIVPEGVPPEYAGTDVAGESELEIKLATNLQLVRRGFYFSETLPNSGPMPPKVGEETTFTVVWSLTNSVSDISGLTLKASLPSYMSWKGVIQPSDAEISFHESTGEITWKIDELKAGTGFIRPAEEVAFQVGLIPGANLAGKAPELVSSVSASGRDMFAELAVEAKASELTLNLPDDTRLEPHQKKVVR